MTAKFEAVLDHGAVVEIPLNKLKKSPKNVRKVPHSPGEIEARAASIAAKGVLQPLVVEPERDEAGQPTGCYLVTIGEGRRLAQCLRASRKQIRKTEPVRCVIDTQNDPSEISLDENVSRTDMHPADQFEAFRDLGERKGWGPEEIGARFGVSAHVVRQRLRLGAVSPRLLDIYREDGLTLDQLMAFGVTEDHTRQEQVFEQLSYNRSPPLIRRAMTEAKVQADDRRAVFVGVEAYAEAGGPVLRDLFTEDRGGWLEDVALLDRLVLEKLVGLATELRETEGWKWAQAHLDYPSSHGCLRVYPHRVERTPEDEARIAELSAAYDALTGEWAEVEDLPEDVEARFAEIDAELQAFGDGYGFDPDEVARGGVLVILGHDGQARVERGWVRPEDVPAPVEAEATDDDGGDGEAAQDGADGDRVEDDEAEDALAPLSDKLIADLTAHRTAGLRDALAENPDVALLCLVHALVLRTFHGAVPASCVDVRCGSVGLGQYAPGIEDAPASRAVEARHEAWARQLPDDPAELWGFVVGLDGDSRAALMAHCVALSVNAVRSWERRPLALAHADAVAQAVGLDMTGYWAPTAAGYFGRVTKARIREAVGEAVSSEAAERLASLTKPEMAQAAEQAVAGTGWLPALLRQPPGVAAEPADAEPSAVAAE
ncbi:MAG: ParB/RepB/Spo0J family partition protein [Phenylobacterium sp.]|uniref:ParB/RepB/Spo0J family partition protein n=1 Tax=Phenylobacterium sp. TaxID=1871053 RepID=UPI0027333CE5|nr:ParB/RepB/Spo0J family partition protein [Phenylobacterium sp.]MDP3746641.1 ParB/RepB/Spo0J family partition protein [Phenylobacterium sp.]